MTSLMYLLGTQMKHLEQYSTRKNQGYKKPIDWIHPKSKDKYKNNCFVG